MTNRVILLVTLAATLVACYFIIDAARHPCLLQHKPEVEVKPQPSRKAYTQAQIKNAIVNQSRWNGTRWESLEREK